MKISFLLLGISIGMIIGLVIGTIVAAHALGVDLVPQIQPTIGGYIL